MSPKDLKTLVKTMRELGVTSLKDGTLELHITPDTPQKPDRKLTESEIGEIRSKAEQFANILGLSDEELFNRICPIAPEDAELEQ